jgi:hypothetical protein
VAVAAEPAAVLILEAVVALEVCCVLLAYL